MPYWCLHQVFLPLYYSLRKLNDPLLRSLLIAQRIDLSPSRRLILVYLVPMFVFLRFCLAAWAYVFVMLRTHPHPKGLNKLNKNFYFAVLVYLSTRQQNDKQLDTKPEIAMYHLVSKNAARVSMIEFVVFLGVLVSAKWCFSPSYVSVRPWSRQTLLLINC